MFREIIIRTYSEEEIEKIDLIRSQGINITELVLSAIMSLDIKPKKKRRLKAAA